MLPISVTVFHVRGLYMGWWLWPQCVVQSYAAVLAMSPTCRRLSTITRFIIKEMTVLIEARGFEMWFPLSGGSRFHVVFWGKAIASVAPAIL